MWPDAEPSAASSPDTDRPHGLTLVGSVFANRTDERSRQEASLIALRAEMPGTAASGPIGAIGLVGRLDYTPARQVICKLSR